MTEDSHLPDPTSNSQDAEKPRLRGLGLSGKLLLLTILFVMVSEVLIYAPSMANFRVTWLEDRVGQARLAARVFDAAPEASVSPDLQERLLDDIGAFTLAVRRGSTRQLLAASEMPEMVVVTVDLREIGVMPAIVEAFALLFTNDPGPMRVVGALEGLEQPKTGVPPPADDSGYGSFIEIVIDQKPLQEAMLAYSLNILTLSIIISIITAGLVYLSLTWLLVRPMRRFTRAMVDFRSNPEDSRRVIAPSGRSDEIGIAENELQTMQRDLSGMLAQKNRLAALGLAVSKISHDLRNMLSAAQLIGDRVGEIEDPAVQRFAPKLVGTLDRAIGFCADTLRYGRAQEPAPKQGDVDLKKLVDELRDTVLPAGVEQLEGIAFYNAVEPGLTVYADPDHLFRVLINLCRNAVQALEGRGLTTPDGDWIAVRAEHDGDKTRILLADGGPGVPDKARATLFQPFGDTTRVGGSGLGLAIAAELIRAHGGRIGLVDEQEQAAAMIPEHFAHKSDGTADSMLPSGPVGAVFEIVLPR
ncbi:MAG: HAMP domain-containing sensor histidine kinase [Pseudomonadota bacterium]